MSWPGPVGTFAGFLQGAAGISAPISVTFLSALHLQRHPFIATIAIFFFALALVQLPTLALIGLLDGQTLLLSCAAIIPLLAGMRLGDAIIQRAKPIWFERAIISVLVLMALILGGKRMGVISAHYRDCIRLPQTTGTDNQHAKGVARREIANGKQKILGFFSICFQ